MSKRKLNPVARQAVRAAQREADALLSVEMDGAQAPDKRRVMMSERCGLDAAVSGVHNGRVTPGELIAKVADSARVRANWAGY